MRIAITVDDPTDAFRKDLLDLLARHAPAVQVDTEWTPERARRYHQALPVRARRILELAVAAGGFVPSENLRDEADGSLRGHSGPLKQALQRGALKGWWPDGMRAPIEPQGPGYGKVQGYLIPDDLLPVFTAACRTDKTT